MNSTLVEDLEWFRYKVKDLRVGVSDAEPIKDKGTCGAAIKGSTIITSYGYCYANMLPQEL